MFNTYNDCEIFLNSVFTDSEMWMLLYQTRGMRLNEIINIINNEFGAYLPNDEKWFSEYITKRFPNKYGLGIQKIVREEYYNYG